MDDEMERQLPEEETRDVYHPRPRWQICAAWVGLGIMILCVILYYWHIASGGRI